MVSPLAVEDLKSYRDNNFQHFLCCIIDAAALDVLWVIWRQRRVEVERSAPPRIARAPNTDHHWFWPTNVLHSVIALRRDEFVEKRVGEEEVSAHVVWASR